MIDDRHPDVTIVIPTYNRARILRATVDQLIAQPFENYELWVIDQSDPVDAEANEFYVRDTGDKRIHYIHLTVKNLPNARNEGLARTRSEIVLFLDDDVIILAEDFIGAHVRAYADPSVGGVVGRHVERSLTMNCRHTACHVSWSGRTIFNLFGTERQRVGSCKGSNMSFRMEAVRQIGGFDRRTALLEETDFSTRIIRAGWDILFEPEAELVHLSSPAGGVREKDELATESRRFRSTAYYILKHRGIVGTPSFVATFMLIAFVRAVRFRSFGVMSTLFLAILSGFADARRGPDQLIPSPSG